MNMENWEDRDLVSTIYKCSSPSLHACTNTIFPRTLYVQYRCKLKPDLGHVALGEDEQGTHLIGCTVLGITSPISSTSELRHMPSMFETLQEDMLAYYAGDPDLVKERGIQTADEDGNIVWLPVPEDPLKQDLLNRMDFYKGAVLKHQGGKQDGELPVHEVNCKLFTVDGRQLSVNIGEWQAGQQHANLPQASMVATPRYLYSIAPEARPDAPPELTIRFRVMWELSLNSAALPSGGSGSTPPRARISSYARRIANAQQASGN